MTVAPSSAGTRAGLALFLGGTAAIGIAYAAVIVLRAPPVWAQWLLVVGAAATPVGLFVVGAVTRGALSRAMTVLLGALLVVLLGSFGAALALPASEGPGGPLLFGLPLRLAIVLYGVGFLPLLALPIAFAASFREVGPADQADTRDGRRDGTP